MSQTLPVSIFDRGPAERYLNRGDAAKFIRERYGRRMSRQTMAKYATIGGGPLYRKFGSQVVYAEADLVAWCEAKLSPRLASTSAVVLDLPVAEMASTSSTGPP